MSRAEEETPRRKAQVQRLSRNKRFDLTELLFTAIISGFVVYIAVTQLHPQLIVAPQLPETVELEQRYGPTRNSEHEEEWIARDYFNDRRDGVFVDVGANHHQRLNNTYFLETALGWSGLAIDPLLEFADGYRKNRPRTRFRPFFVSDVSNDLATMFYVKGNSLITSGDRSFSDLAGEGPPVELIVPTITMNDLLARENIASFDFLTMDIELAEPLALKGFDIERFRPALVCIEAHPEVRQQLLDYFAKHHYVVLGKYLRLDTANLYFAPLQPQ